MKDSSGQEKTKFTDFSDAFASTVSSSIVSSDDQKFAIEDDLNSFAVIASSSPKDLMALKENMRERIQSQKIAVHFTDDISPRNQNDKLHSKSEVSSEPFSTQDSSLTTSPIVKQAEPPKAPKLRYVNIYFYLRQRLKFSEDLTDVFKESILSLIKILFISICRRDSTVIFDPLIFKKFLV